MVLQFVVVCSRVLQCASVFYIDLPARCRCDTPAKRQVAPRVYDREVKGRYVGGSWGRCVGVSAGVCVCTGGCN